MLFMEKVNDARHHCLLIFQFYWDPFRRAGAARERQERLRPDAAGGNTRQGGFMKAVVRCLCFALMLSGSFAKSGFGQKALTWQEIRDKFEAANPTLRAGQIGIDELRAQEITAYLRPNPSAALLADQIDPFNGGPPHSTFGTLLNSATFSYLHERQHKRELRQESAQKATGIAVSGQADLERTLLFTLRSAFVQTLQEKSILELAKENLTYYDHVLSVNSERYKAGAIAHVDLDRLELQRVQYESDLQTAEVNLRTAKIQLLALLNDRTPIEQFDVTGPFDFSAQIAPLEEVRQTALETRPDLKAALQSIEKAKTDHRLAVANGSTDPTFGFDVGRNPPIDQYIGFGVSIPLRIFDRNQGEKKRTELDIDREEKLMEATQAQVFSDVDSAHATVMSTVILLQPYKDRYLQQASRVRETIAFSYEHGAASLLDFLNAQAEYRSVQVNYLNLVASYLNAASQLNLAVGREVLQ
jgi:cobalt-zinc-cadmium efflux system outer membrane protein